MKSKLKIFLKYENLKYISSNFTTKETSKLYYSKKMINKIMLSFDKLTFF